MNGKEDQTNKRRTGLSCFPPGEGAVLAAVIANLLANGLDAAQIAVLAAFVTTIGDSLGYISAQMALNQELIENGNNQGAADAAILQELLR